MKSLNEGDVFLLLTETELFQWIGHESNGFERAKSGDVSSCIVRGKEMGCRAKSVIVFEPQSVEQQPQNMQHFLKLLGGSSSSLVNAASVGGSDEKFQQESIELGTVYAVAEQQKKLVRLSEKCGRVLEYSMLTPTEVYVFDFFTEVYIWIGRCASREIRQQGMQQAKDLYKAGYQEDKKRSKSFHRLGNWMSTRRRSRPNWALLMKVTEGAEPFLFKEKFVDWPGTGSILRSQQRVSIISNISTKPIQLKPCDITAMKKRPPSLPDFVLFGKNLGRGLTVTSSTHETALTVWNIKEFDYHKVPESQYGLFYSNECYVIRWSQSFRSRSTSNARHSNRLSIVNQDNCCYFFWLGEKCTVTEQGATAMLTVELDEERGPQIRVCQGKEPPAFLQLFNGGMIICSEERSRCQRQTRNRMFWIGGEMPNEAHLVEIPVPSAHALRSHSCLLVSVPERHEIILWKGCKAAENSCSVAETAANRLLERLRLEEKGDMQLLNIVEGHEDAKFWKAVGGKQDYYSLLQESKYEPFTPRLFRLSRASGKFAAEEVLCPSRPPDGICTFPFMQSDLYNSSQPAIFLLDAQCCVYLWCGWWPADQTDGNSKSITGLAASQWSQDKELAMKTAVNYAKSIGEDCPAYTVVAGWEPPQFKSVFPVWLDLKEQYGVTNHKCDQNKLQLIQQLTTADRKFTIEELRARTTPSGLDPIRLESYLSDKDFKEVFGMSRDAFSALPAWKKTQAKQAVGLY
ncbi:supervillin-like isoform X2 [Corticium candelabrum]|nr:supervillin-like isoform X2 [Corticium candelabrum]